MGRIVIAALVPALWTLAGTARAYPTPTDFNGKVQRWNIDIASPPLTYAVKGDDDALAEYGSAIPLAMQKWQDVATSYVSFTEAASYDEAQITIALNSKGVGNFSSGYTQIDTDEKGEMAHAHVEILVGDTISFETFAKTALHEIGHTIGLGHSLMAHSIMSYQLDQSEFNLDTDDIAAITRLYPADGSKPKLPPGCSVRAGEKGSATALLLWLFWPSLALGRALAKSRRNRQAKSVAPQATGP